MVCGALNLKDKICVHYGYADFVSSVCGSQILAINRIINAVVEVEHLCECQPCHGFDTLKDFGLGNFAARNQPVAMLTFIHTEDIVWRNCIPEGKIIERLQPLNHVINVFENHTHVTSIPEADVVCQFWEVYT